VVEDELTSRCGRPDPECRDASGVRPSTVKLPAQPPHGVRTVFEFFVRRFPRIPRETWSDRFANGGVWAADGPLGLETPYSALQEVHYRREVGREPPVRTDYRVVWADRHLMVVDKPPNLPVTPGGRWVRGCLLHHLELATGNREIVPLHRLDRLTSGLVLLSLDAGTRSHYSRLFQPSSRVEKVYTAVCEQRRDSPPPTFTLAHHITRSPDEYWRQIVVEDRPANARCEVEVMAMTDGLVLARVRPSTGRKHQIRVQLAHNGLPILGDPLYGTARSYRPDDLTQRLWLDAYRLTIRDFPLPGGPEVLTRDWTSRRTPERLFERAVEFGATSRYPQ